MGTPLVSAIIPVGPGVCRAGENSLTWLKAAITSALTQRPPKETGWPVALVKAGWLELVVAIEDRGGNDPVILADWPRDVRIVSGGSPAATRNAGIAKSGGRWLAFLDADDCWLHDKIALQLAAVACPNAGSASVIYSNARVIDSEGREQAASMPWVGPISGLRDLIQANRIPLSTAMIRRDVFNRVGGFNPEMAIAEDYDLWLRVAAAGGRFCYVPQSLASYRVHPGQASADPLRMAQGVAKALRSAWLQTLSAECGVRNDGGL